jgi:hypothetical protein
MALDILGPLNRTKKGNVYCLVVADHFTKWTEAFPIRNQKAHTVADVLCKQVFCRIGIPYQLHSDQGRDFESHLFQLFGLDKTRTTAYHPQSDGQVEKFNSTVAQMLSMYVDAHQSDWDEHLPFVMCAYRSTVQESTGCTPNQMMLGRNITLPIDLLMGPAPNAVGSHHCYVEYVGDMHQAMEEAFQFVRRHLQRSAESQKKYYDRQTMVRPYKAGDWVLRYYPPQARGKLGWGWIGPLLIVGKLNDVNYKIQASKKSKVQVVHVNHLKLWEAEDEDNPPVSWLDGTELGLGNLVHRGTQVACPTEDHAIQCGLDTLDDRTDTLTLPIQGDPPSSQEIPPRTGVLRRGTRDRKATSYYYQTFH